MPWPASSDSKVQNVIVHNHSSVPLIQQLRSYSTRSWLTYHTQFPGKCTVNIERPGSQSLRPAIVSSQDQCTPPSWQSRRLFYDKLSWEINFSMTFPTQTKTILGLSTLTSMIRGPCPWPYETNVHQMSNTAHSTFPFDPVDLFLSFRTLYSKQKWLSWSCTGKEMLRDGIILFLLPRLSQTLSARLYARVLSLYYYDSLSHSKRNTLFPPRLALQAKQFQHHVELPVFTWHDGTNAHSNLDFTGTTVLTAVRSTIEKSSLEKNVHRPQTSCTHRFLADQKEIIIFANRQNFSIEMFAGNVALSSQCLRELCLLCS